MAKLKSGTRVYGDLVVDTAIDFGTSVLSTAIQGELEFDGTAFYGSPADSTRGVIPTEHLIVLSSSNTLASQTGVQPLFDGGGGPTNGALTLPVGTYKFECFYALTNMSTGTTASFGFALGGTASKSEGWYASATKSAFTTASALTGTWNVGANTALTSTNTTATGYAFIKGHFRITVAGTIIPQVSLGAANAAVVQTNSYFYCSPVGNATAVSVGNWS